MTEDCNVTLFPAYIQREGRATCMRSPTSRRRAAAFESPSRCLASLLPFPSDDQALEPSLLRQLDVWLSRRASEARARSDTGRCIAAPGHSRDKVDHFPSPVRRSSPAAEPTTPTSRGLSSTPSRRRHICTRSAAFATGPTSASLPGPREALARTSKPSRPPSFVRLFVDLWHTRRGHWLS